MKTTGKRISRVIVYAGLAIFAIAVFVSFNAILERWYIWQLESSDQSVRMGAVEQLAAIKSSRAAEPLFNALRASSGRFEEEKAYIEAIVRIGNPAVPLLIAALHDSDSSTDTAALILSRIGGPEAIAALLEGLRSANASTRKGASLALEFADGLGVDAIPSFTATLEDPDPWIRRRSIHGLVKIGSDAASAIPTLERLLLDPEAVVRTEAMQAIEKIRGPQ